MYLLSGLVLKTSDFPAAGANRLNHVVHHDRAGGRQLWYLLQRGAVYHQGLVGEFLLVALHSLYTTTDIALTAALLVCVSMYTCTILAYTGLRCVC